MGEGSAGAPWFRIPANQKASRSQSQHCISETGSTREQFSSQDRGAKGRCGPAFLELSQGLRSEEDAEPGPGCPCACGKDNALRHQPGPLQGPTRKVSMESGRRGHAPSWALRAGWGLFKRSQESSCHRPTALTVKVSRMMAQLFRGTQIVSRAQTWPQTPVGSLRPVALDLSLAEQALASLFPAGTPSA